MKNFFFILIIACLGCKTKQIVTKQTEPNILEENKIPKEETKIKATETIEVTFIPLEVAEPMTEERSIYENTCAKCHTLYDKKTYSAENWKPIVLRMQKMANFSDQEKEKILIYLSKI